ncbi:hypothetical protein, partial [Streptococcus thermophilus]|uniref:hypothetical protein n=1 Tax=Streptococcus thermophilus TaxID=1308 RepID=UPI0022FD3DA7
MYQGIPDVTVTWVCNRRLVYLIRCRYTYDKAFCYFLFRCKPLKQTHRFPPLDDDSFLLEIVQT